MAVFELPYIYGMQAIPPHGRLHQVFAAVDHAPALVPEAEGVPVVARVTAVANCQIQHTALERYSKQATILGSGEVLEYRAWNGALWRPVRSSPRQYPPTPAAPVRADDIEALERTWREGISRNHEAIPIMSLQTERPPLFKERFERGRATRSRDVKWSDKETRLEAMRADANRGFSVLDGILHVMTHGPVWKITERSGPRLCTDGVPASWRKFDFHPAMGATFDEVGLIEILDADRFAACVPDLREMLLASAAREVLNDVSLTRHIRMPRDILAAMGALAAMFPHGDHLDIGDPGAIEDVLRTFDRAFPLVIPQADGEIRRFESPATDYLDCIDRLDAAAEPTLRLGRG